MPPTKSPGADGMNVLFFQKYWHVVGDDVSSVCLQILNGLISVKPFNHTLISLIAKIKTPSLVSDFHPISLCSVIYRLIAKTFANRLKFILSSIISPTQSAFVPHCHILDNAMMSFETMFVVKRLKSVDDPQALALKLDMAKAYDRVEWKFLEAMMLRLGFPSEWVRRMMDCLSTVSFSVLWQGESFGHIIPHRGLRQGCPLCPYLFLFCTEGLSCLLNQASLMSFIKGIRVAPTAPLISHLFYADDSLLFLELTSDILLFLNQFWIFMVR